MPQSEKLRTYAKEYYQDNKEYFRELNKSYRNNNKAFYDARAKQKYNCLVCDGKYTYAGKAAHTKTIKHRRAIFVPMVTFTME